MNSNWNPEMMKAFEMIMKIDPIFKKIFDQIGLPQNRTMKQGFQSLAKIIKSAKCARNMLNQVWVNALRC